MTSTRSVTLVADRPSVARHAITSVVACAVDVANRGVTSEFFARPRALACSRHRRCVRADGPTCAFRATHHFAVVRLARDFIGATLGAQAFYRDGRRTATYAPSTTLFTQAPNRTFGATTHDAGGARVVSFAQNGASPLSRTLDGATRPFAATNFAVSLFGAFDRARAGLRRGTIEHATIVEAHTASALTNGFTALPRIANRSRVVANRARVVPNRARVDPYFDAGIPPGIDGRNARWLRSQLGTRVHRFDDGLGLDGCVQVGGDACVSFRWARQGNSDLHIEVVVAPARVAERGPWFGFVVVSRDVVFRGWCRRGRRRAQVGTPGLSTTRDSE